MNTINSQIEAAAPASVRPSSVLKTRAFATHKANRELPMQTVLSLLKAQLPKQYELAEIIGQWIWLDFPARSHRAAANILWRLGFHWNQRRCLWQHPCGACAPYNVHSGDPRQKFGLAPLPPLTPEMTMNMTPDFPALVAPFKFPATAYEYKVMPLRECPLPEAMQQCKEPNTAADYWRRHIATHPHFNPECECLAALLLNARKKIKGHQLVSIGTQDTILVHPREVFRLAVITAAHAMIIMHNHPSGESAPSKADIKVTRNLIRASQLLKIELLDHVIIGNGNRSSLRELGYFA